MTAYELQLPDVWEGLREATILTWLVEAGDTVELNQPLVEIETAKAVVEVPSPRAGVVLHVAAPAGAVLEIGALLTVIGDPDDTWTSPDHPAGQPAEPDRPEVPEGDPRTIAHRSPAPPSARPLATPMVRRLAADLGVDLGELAGSGRPVTREDVVAAAHRVAGAGQRLSGVRRSIAANMTAAWATPQVTAWDLAMAEPLLQARRERGAPIEALVIEAILPVLDELREFSAHFDGETLTPAPTHDIGIAIDSPAGLLVGVLHDAGSMDRETLASETAQLLDRGRARRLAPHELHGQTFTLSNIGAVGGRFGTAIVPVNTTALLSVGRAAEEVCAVEGTVVIRTMLPLGLSFDHRVIDGASAQRFLTRVCEEVGRIDSRQ